MLQSITTQALSRSRSRASSTQRLQDEADDDNDEHDYLDSPREVDEEEVEGQLEDSLEVFEPLMRGRRSRDRSAPGTPLMGGSRNGSLRRVRLDEEDGKPGGVLGLEELYCYACFLVLGKLNVS